MEQFVFRRKLTTEKVTYNLTYKVLNALNNKFTVKGLFCHLEIFNSVNHHILLSKLECCGTIGNDNALYESYLHDKYQRVYIYEKIIPLFVIGQGSILGSLLFLLYIYIYIYAI